MKKNTTDKPAPAGRVTSQDVTIAATVGRCTAPTPRAKPTPSTAPTSVCVVEMGMPVAEASTTVVAAASYADDPLGPVFDPQLMLDLLNQGTPEQTLTTRAWAASGPDMPHPLALFAGQQ